MIILLGLLLFLLIVLSYLDVSYIREQTKIERSIKEYDNEHKR